MGNDAEYHRTFNKFSIDPKWKPVRPASAWDVRAGPYPKAAAETLRKRREEQYAKKVGAIDAYQLVGDRISPTRIVAKPDQLFWAYATVWELFYSTLTPNWKRRVSPVVDEKLMVVGHLGWWDSTEVLIPATRARTMYLNEVIEEGLPVFASTRNPMPDYYKTNDLGGSDGGQFLLLTSVDGFVEAKLKYEMRAGAESAPFPWDYLPITPKGAIRIVLGRVILSGAGKSFLIRMIAGIGKRLRERAGGLTAREAAEAASKSGTIHSVHVGVFGEPGHVIARIDLEQGDVVYRVASIHLKAGGNLAELEARAAHLDMMKRAAQEAQKRGQAKFTVRGIDANANFQARFDKLAREIGVSGSGKRLPGSAQGNYEVTLKADKVLKWAEREIAKIAARQAARVAGRMSAEEMEKYLQSVLAKRPDLKSLMAARALKGEPLQKEILRVLHEWEKAQRWTVKFVKPGAAQAASGRAGNLLWLNKGERVLWIEDQVLKNPEQLLKEVRHELVAHALGGGHGTRIAYIEMANGQVWSAQVILENAVERGDLKGVVKFFAGK
jgi:hypothetical protein